MHSRVHVCTSTAWKGFVMYLQNDVFCSGHCGELFCYWQFLDPALNVMAGQYHQNLKKMEEEGWPVCW